MVVELAGDEESWLGYLVPDEEDSCDASMRGQLLVALDDERCHGSSKETSLWSIKVRAQGT